MVVQPFSVDFAYLKDSKYYPFQSHHRKLYGEVVSLCVNQEIRSDFGLEAYAEIEYCHEPNRTAEPLDTWDVVCISIICLLAGMAVSKDFLFLEGFRFVTMASIILLHTSMELVRVPLQNPEIVEETVSNPVMAAIALLTPNLVQWFFTIGGLLLTVNLLDLLDKDPKSVERWWNVLWDKVINRLKRILPVYLLVMLVTATLYRRIQLGPLHERIVGSESKNCRTSWWSNLLFVNNYINANETCLRASWYLSADFQFYLFGLFALLTMHRFPKTVKYWIGFMVTLNLAGPSLEMWFRELPPLFTSAIRISTPLFIEDEWLERMYKPFHTSSAGYFYGIMAGLLYQRYKSSENRMLFKKVLSAVKLLAMCCLAACYLPALFIYEGKMDPLSRMMPTYGALVKNCFGFTVAALLINMALNKKDRLRQLMQHRYLLPLGKLTYCVYHNNVLLLAAASSAIQSPVIVGVPKLILCTAITLVLSYGLGLVMFLLIEQPVANLLASKPASKKRI
ncbi:nose resistant to fluoxetine protein 6 [Culex quinquefasciatus]|uniref:nose resistant to fluoxetine protein 6 n=1 Tax=Culex quinquefasciatus TaxID=7176 RepID=UPI0018E2F97D|nr:nose resistant to fluoxetine protein 6 [Culex quinquefasciatus]